MKVDTRPAVLLLRSFVDDALELPRESTEVDRFTFEEALTHELWRWGPVVAIGRPGEDLPLAGAAREYRTNEDWRGRITKFLEHARCVVFVVHKTEGLRWELQEIRKSGCLFKTIFVVPPLQNEDAKQRWSGLWQDDPVCQDHTSLPGGIAVFLKADAETEVAIRASAAIPTADDYDLGIELAMRIISGYVSSLQNEAERSMTASGGIAS